SFDFTNGTIDLPILISQYGLKSKYSDRLGAVWFGTDEGIYLASKGPKYFRSFLTDQPKMISCRGMTEDHQGHLHVFTHSGQFIFLHGARARDEKIKPESRSSLAAITVSDGHIWFTSESSSCTRYNPVTGEVKNYDFGIQLVPYFACWSINQIKSGLILLGST